MRLAPASSTNVTGVATLGGATVNAIFSSGAVTSRYTILTAADSMSGTFNPHVVSNSPNLSATLSYDANDVFLNVALRFTTPENFNPNQRTIANVLTTFFNTNGSIPVAFALLTPTGLTQVSGESASSSRQTTFNATNQFMSVMTDPFVDGRGGNSGFGSDNGSNSGFGSDSGNNTGFGSDNGSNTGNNNGLGSNTGNNGGLGPRSDMGGSTSSTSAYASEGHDAPGTLHARREREAYAAMSRKAPVAGTFAQRWSVWAAGYGGSQVTDGNTAQGTSATTSRIVGTVVGADYRFSPNTVAGFALGGGGTNFAVANGLGGGRSDLFQAGAFVKHTAGPAYIIGRSVVWLAGRHHQSHASPSPASISSARSSMPMRGRAVSRAAIASSRQPSAASASRPMPPGRSRRSCCRPMPSSVVGGQQHLRADLHRKGRHGDAQRTRPAHRQILRDGQRAS